MESAFKVDIDHSIDRATSFGPNQFGYSSMHYVISYSDERLSLPEFTKLRGLKAEIQLRTLLQHTWAAIDWNVRYKNKIGVPPQLSRRLFRISALFEVADDEFSNLSYDIDKLRTEYRKELESGAAAIAIDINFVGLFLSNEDSVRALILLVEKCGFAIAPLHPHAKTPYQALLTTLTKANITQTDVLREKLEAVVSDGPEKFQELFNS